MAYDEGLYNTPGAIVVDIQPAIFQITYQLRPLIQAVGDGFAK
jgi:hypothetical protein